MREAPGARIFLNERLHLRNRADLLRERDHSKSSNEPERDKDCKDLSRSIPFLATTNLRQRCHLLRNSASELMTVDRVDPFG